MLASLGAEVDLRNAVVPTVDVEENVLAEALAKIVVENPLVSAAMECVAGGTAATALEPTSAVVVVEYLANDRTVGAPATSPLEVAKLMSPDTAEVGSDAVAADTTTLHKAAVVGAARLIVLQSVATLEDGKLTAQCKPVAAVVQ